MQDCRIAQQSWKLCRFQIFRMDCSIIQDRRGLVGEKTHWCCYIAEPSLKRFSGWCFRGSRLTSVVLALIENLWIFASGNERDSLSFTRKVIRQWSKCYFAITTNSRQRASYFAGVASTSVQVSGWRYPGFSNTCNLAGSGEPWMARSLWGINQQTRSFAARTTFYIISKPSRRWYVNPAEPKL